MVTRGCRFAQIFGKRQMVARPEMRHADILEVFELLLVRVHPPNIFSFIVRQPTLSPFGLNHVLRDLPAVLGSGRRPSSHFDS